jgi:predicted AlkP superfamily pyrophosphatase or phosphodiesterase
MRPKVLIVGIDGARADVMARVAGRPGSALGALARRGAWTFDARTVSITQSAPAWATILTGGGIARHGVRDNSFRPNTLNACPHFATRLRRTTGARRTASIVNWAPINEHLVDPRDVAVTEEHAADGRVCARAVERLERDDDLDALFVHLDAVDAWGHRACYSRWSPLYRWAAQRADRMLGVMLAAVARRRHRHEEDWLVISVSDHGGRWFGHGGDDDDNRRVHLVVAGDRVRPRRLAGRPSVADVAASALAHLAPGPDATRDLDGRAHGAGGAWPRIDVPDDSR